MDDNGSTDHRRYNGEGKKAVVLIIAAAMLVAGERLAQDWLLPGMAVDLALEQLQSDDAVASKLRLFDAAGQLLPLGTAMAIVVVGVVVFAPKPRVSIAWFGDRVSWFRARFARSAFGSRFVRQTPAPTEDVKAKSVPDPLHRGRGQARVFGQAPFDSVRPVG